MDPARQQQHGLQVPLRPLPHFVPAPFFQQQNLGASTLDHEQTYGQYNQHYCPRQPRYLPSQGLRAQKLQSHQPYTTFFGPPQVAPVVMNPALNNEHQPFAPGYSSDDARAMFAGDFDDYAIASGSTNLIPSKYYAPAYTTGSFRPLPTSSGVDTSHLVTAPMKHESTPAACVMPLQTSMVDTREYSPVPVDEVLSTPMEPASPSTIDTDGHSPLTPIFDNPAAFSQIYASKYGPLEQHLFSAPQLTQVPLASQSSYGSFSSISSTSSCSGSSFSGPSLARDDTCIQPQHGLPIGHMQSHVTPANPELANRSFDDAVSSLEDHVSETEAGDGMQSGGSSPSLAEHSVADMDRNKLLVRLRKQGLSYKEIKQRYGFKEAESTLRGRWRMLTKERHERVRKPVWQKSDVTLLRRAVRQYQKTTSGRRSVVKLPWLKISEYMLENGASYAFAPATCAKKWAGIRK